MGDYEHKQILFLAMDQEVPLSVDLEVSPITGLLMKDDQVLAIGCEGNTLVLLSLLQPNHPKPTHTIKL